MDAANGAPEEAEVNDVTWGAAEALFGKMRLGVLSLLYTHPDLMT